MARLKLRLRTFIPSEKVFFSSVDITSTYYAGDKRTEALWSTNDYRTVHAFSIDTSKKNYGLVEVKNLVKGSTRLVYVANKLVDTKSSKDLTTNTGLTYSYQVKSDDCLYITVKCHAKNQLVALAPAIDYNFVIKVTRTGSVRITGKLDGFPAYEFWRQIEGKAKGPELVYSHIPKVNRFTVLTLAPFLGDKSVDVGLSYNS